jgi:hypothetical protein
MKKLENARKNQKKNRGINRKKPEYKIIYKTGTKETN